MCTVSMQYYMKYKNKVLISLNHIFLEGFSFQFKAISSLFE